jgi:hypothetical protein
LKEAVGELNLATFHPQHRPDLDKDPWRWGNNITEGVLARAAEVWSRGDYFDLWGPFMTLYFHPGVCQIACWWVSWWTFLENEAVQLATRHVCRELARCLALRGQSPVTMYLPDSCFPESEALERGDGSVAAIARWLESRFGPPRPTIESIYGEDSGGAPVSRGYYVERFDGGGG